MSAIHSHSHNLSRAHAHYSTASAGHQHRPQTTGAHHHGGHGGDEVSLSWQAQEQLEQQQLEQQMKDLSNQPGGSNGPGGFPASGCSPINDPQEWNLEQVMGQI